MNVPISAKWKLAQFLEIRWWKHYLKGRSVAEYASWKKAYWQGFLDRIELHVAEDARCLDAGCGPAGIFSMLTQQDVVCIDPLLDQYQDMEVHRSLVHQRCQRTTTTLEKYRDAEGFDVIFCLNAINHVADIHQAITSLNLAMRKAGTLVLTVDAHRNRWFKTLFHWIPIDALHPHQCTAGEYQRILESHGIRVCRRVNLRSQFFFDYIAFICEKN